MVTMANWGLEKAILFKTSIRHYEASSLIIQLLLGTLSLLSQECYHVNILSPDLGHPLSVLLGTWNLLNAILAADEFVFGKRLRESGAAKNHFSRGFSELLKPHIFVLPARDFLPLLE
jgi:hypothetical protein